MKIPSLLLAAACIGFVHSAGAADIGMGSNPWYTPTLQNNLQAQGNNVTVVNSYTAASLSNFDVYIQDGNSYFDQSALQSFVNGGGTLIELPWSLDQNYSYSGPLHLMGNNGGITYGSANPAVNVLDPGNALLNNVVTPAAGQYTVGYETGATFLPGATPILSWADGTALLAAASYGAGEVIAFNLHLITSDSHPLNAPWSNQIVYNAVNLSGVSPVPEPGTYAMLLAGLGIVGLLAFGRQRRSNEGGLAAA